LGIADAAISDTASGNITIKGGVASNGLSSLTVGSTYYVHTSGCWSKKRDVHG
jgi:phage tail sheath gpL-like